MPPTHIINPQGLRTGNHRPIPLFHLPILQMNTREPRGGKNSAEVVVVVSCRTRLESGVSRQAPRPRPASRSQPRREPHSAPWAEAPERDCAEEPWGHCAARALELRSNAARSSQERPGPAPGPAPGPGAAGLGGLLAWGPQLVAPRMQLLCLRRQHRSRGVAGPGLRDPRILSHQDLSQISVVPSL